MAIRRIFEFPDSILRQKASPVTDINGKIQQLIDDMVETMYVAPGIGLAGNQVGEPLRILVCDPSSGTEPNGLVVLLNPEITNKEGVVVGEEGCLSVVDYRADVKRAERITIEGVNREGNRLVLECDGIMAIVLQHEVDHLNGLLFIDHIGPLRKELYTRRLKKILKEKKGR